MVVSRPVLSPGWTNDYVSPPVPFLIGGRDRSGWDCWGLLRAVYAEQFGIELPLFAGEYETAEDYEAIGLLYEQEVGSWEQVTQPREGDAVWMSVLGQPSHVGVYLSGPSLLHALPTGTRIDRINSHSWQRRIRAYYRHSAIQ